MKQNLLLIFLMLLYAPLAFSQGPAKGAIEAFAARTGALPTIDRATNSLGFLRFPSERAFLVSGGDAVQKSMNFVDENKVLFGLRDNEDEFRLRKQESDIYGLENITLEQTYKGVPVYDGLMKFHYDGRQGLTSLNGNYISDIKVNVSPTLAQHEAEERAIRQVKAQYQEAAESVEASKSFLCIFQKGLVQGFNGVKLLVYQVEVRNNEGIREFVFVDAHNGQVVEQFTGTHHLTRRLYQNSLANLVWSEGNAFPGTLDKWQQSEVQTSGFIYNLMKNNFGRTSYNGADAPMITINNKTGIQCPNAQWDGVSANYCTGIATDDVVAHEWAHAYTEYTSQLVYGWQPGALNEAYSDIWGETVDMLNGYMDEGESNAARTGCGSSQRWIVGEKIEVSGDLKRDMWNPTCFGQPGKLSDPQYWCASTDYGGVHINSGVVNHAYALLVDGGTYNGQTITGIGLTKAAHIFWRAQSVFMTATTDFSAQADILEASAAGLLGVNLMPLSTAPTLPAGTPVAITNNDLLQLAKVIAAVELRENNSCQFYTVLEPAPALCEGANQGLAIFYENFETGLGGFTTSQVPGDATDWFNRSWIQANAPAGRPGKVAYGIDYTGGNCTDNMQYGVIRMESPAIAIPAGTAGNLNMAFDHYVAMEDTWDGGNIKYRINGGAWTLLPASAFTVNPYNNFLNSSMAGNLNPLASEPVFTGVDQGVVLGSWGQSQVDLSSIGLVPGNTIQFRFEVGTDGCRGWDGWYIDDFRVYSCAVTPAVHFTATSAVVNEAQATTAGAGCLDYIDKTVTVQIDKAPTQPVTVTFKTPTGTAKQGADYTISPASVTLSSGALTQNVTIRVFNDAYMEDEETIDLSYDIDAHGGNGFAASGFQNFRFTILDNDLTPGNYADTLLNSNFNNTAPGWSVVNGGNSSLSWGIIQFTNAGLDAAKSPFFFVNSNIQNGNLHFFDEYLESPPINSSGKKNLVLTFSQDWRPYFNADNDQGNVEVWDGANWQTLLTQNQTTGRKGNILTYTPDIVNLPIPDAYANPNMKIRFHYIGHWEYWWAIDDVKVTATNSTQVISAVNTGNAAQEYLGPNETAVFYDPSTGNLMAKIKNLSAHDYGCTTVEVDRSGANGTPWLSSYQVTNKTFKVTPTNNNPAGQYEITLYYKGSELNTFLPANIQSMGKTTGTIAAATSANTTLAAATSTPAFGADYAFTAIFSTGFSGFGLTNAPPGAALPVTLVHFEGKNTHEGNVLQWTTSAESNSDYFAIEESTNGKNFTESGRVKAAGNTSVLNHYDFTDADFNKGITYYRLKQVDFDGTFAYSSIVAIDAPSAGNIRFYPNPVQSALYIELPNLPSGWVNARVIDAAGREVFVKEKAAVQNGKLNIQLGKLPAGIYQVLIVHDKVSYRLSVFKP
ncbi:Por secretion system C-terminal sorting domain-containing protein [Dyadobacter soli]|uniref:Por secretion system C-terminal sorting domain-containing protein n=1 Tax=Dyadobacter soli TaxID=659014 RepID=A0A1G7KZX3_9BACT|nr:M4 family metallopeptidase [Dyadobacter soli]SDF42691.1 Por secretion system C-terminal sorting domain-containing protein [Dyadobacter soli]